jgi:hypothetical protein
MSEDAEPAVSNPPPLAPEGGEPAGPKRSLYSRYWSFTFKGLAAETGPAKFGVVLAISFYWIIGFWAFQTHSEIFRIFSAYGATFLTIALMVGSGFWRRWAFWIEPAPDEKAGSRRADLRKNATQAIVAILALVSTFALLSAILHPFLDNTTVVYHGNAAWNYTKAYLWNTIDAIPVLQINETIHWAMPPLFGTKLGQANEILFRLLVIAPGLSVIIQYFQY